MEYKKEYEKFSFGIGQRKVAGKGNLSEAENENSTALEAVLTVVAIIGAGLFKSAVRKKSNKKKRRK